MYQNQEAYRYAVVDPNSGKFYYGMTDERKAQVRVYTHSSGVLQGSPKAFIPQIIRNLCAQSEQPQPNKIDLFSTMQSAGPGTC